MGNPLTTTGRPSLNQTGLTAGGKNIAENWFGEHQQNRSGEVALEKIVTANPAVIIAMNKRDADAILSSPQWASVDAVIHHRVYVNPKGMFWWCRETSEEALQFCGWRKRFILRDLLMWIYAKRRVSFIGSSLA